MWASWKSTLTAMNATKECGIQTVLTMKPFVTHSVHSVLKVSWGKNVPPVTFMKIVPYQAGFVRLAIQPRSAEKQKSHYFPLMNQHEKHFELKSGRLFPPSSPKQQISLFTSGCEPRFLLSELSQSSLQTYLTRLNGWQISCQCSKIFPFVDLKISGQVQGKHVKAH